MEEPAFFRKEAKLGAKEFSLTKEGATILYKYPHVRYRFLPDEYFSPNPIFLYGDRIAIVVWEPLNIVRIQSRDLADAWRKYFWLLWKIAYRKRSAANGLNKV